MIDPESLLPLCNFGKPVGYKGKISLSFHSDVELRPGMFIFVNEEGLLVPWRITEADKKGDGYNVALRGIDSQQEIKRFSGATAYLPIEYFPELDDEETITYDQLVGFRVFDGDKEIGTVADVDDSTVNVVLDVETADGRHVLVPAADDFIVELNIGQKFINMTLPEGLIDLN